MPDMPKRSGFVNQIEEMRKQAQSQQDLLRDVTDACWHLPDEDMPPIGHINIIGSDSVGHFKGAMTSFFAEFATRFKLTPASRILDIGSGCGRLAIPFSLFLNDDGRYYGVDVWKDGIDWCAGTLSPANPSLSFHHMEAANNYYADAYDPSVQNDYTLGFIPEKGLDFAFAISVFTHLTPKDSQDYLTELGRTLDDDGAAYLTCFIIDDFFFKHVETTGMHRAVKQVEDGFYQAYEGQDFFGGYTRRKWEAMLAEAGLRTISHEVGSWASKPGARVYQDMFIVMRTKG